MLIHRRFLARLELPAAKNGMVNFVESSLAPSGSPANCVASPWSTDWLTPHPRHLRHPRDNCLHRWCALANTDRVDRVSTVRAAVSGGAGQPPHRLLSTAYNLVLMVPVDTDGGAYETIVTSSSDRDCKTPRVVCRHSNCETALIVRHRLPNLNAAIRCRWPSFYPGSC